VYNGAATLGRAIDSVLRQSSPAHEIIVVDDGSTDATAEVAARYRDRIRYVRQDNRGVSAARNHGVELATGDWLAFLDADDEYFPDRLAWHARWIAEDAGLDFLTGDQAYRNPDGSTIRTHMAQTPAGKMLLAKAAGALRVVMEDPSELRAFVACHFGDTHTLSVPRRTFQDAGGYPLGRAVCEDVSLLIRLVAHSRRVGVITQPMAAYYIYPSSATRRDPVRAQRQTVEALALLERSLGDAPAHVAAGLQDALASARMDCAVALLRSGRRLQALAAVCPNLVSRPGFGSARQVLSVLRGL
jgi:GT2 family glycosyltransferase